MNRTRGLAIVLWLLCPLLGFSQGLLPRSFTFAELPGSVRLLALGGAPITASTHDLSLFWANPALLNAAHHQQVALSIQGYYSSTVLQSSYAQHRPWGTLAAGVTGWHMGNIMGYDDRGTATTPYRTGAWVSSVAYARQQGPFQLGVAIKLAGQPLIAYGGTALLTDIAGIYQHPTKDMRVGLVVSNLGAKLGGHDDRPLPYNVRLGMSIKPEHMPIRFSITLTDLYQWNTLHFDSTTARTIPEPSLAQQALAHVVVGGEILLGSNLSLMVGYNGRRRIEMRVPDLAGATGMSFGLEASIKAFTFGYGVGFLHLAGGTHQVSLAVDLQQWLPSTRTVNAPIPGLEE